MFVASVVAALRQVRPDRHGESWALLVGEHDRIAAWVDDDVADLSFRQNLETVIAGFEAAWAFFGGVFRVVIPDNMATIVTTADACAGFNEAFTEYAQSRGFVVDPARVRSPQDKPRVERTVQFVQTSFWAGEAFGCLAGGAQLDPAGGGRWGTPGV